MTPTTPSAPDEVVLAPCPFCGGKAEIVDAEEAGPDARVVCCTGCLASSKVIFALKEDVTDLLVEEWNRRASPQPAGVTEEQDVPVEWREETRLRKQAAWLREQSIEGALFGTVTSLADDLMHYADVIEKLRARLPSSTDTRERGHWFALSGDARLGACSTDGCGGQPTWRLEAGGVGSNYCSGCKAKIEALKPTEAPVEDGWIEWNGGECPIKRSDRVQVRFRTGDETTPLTGTNDFNWKHINEPGDIIAYRLAASTKEE